MLRQQSRDHVYKRAVGVLLIASVLSTAFILGRFRQTTAVLGNAFHLNAMVERADGLEVSASVTMAGIKVGNVVEITLTTDNRVRLDMEIERRHAHKIRENSKGRLVRPVIGPAFVEISLSTTDGIPLRDGESISLTRAADFNDIVASLPPIIGRVGETLAQVEAVTKNLRKITDQAMVKGGAVESSVLNIQRASRDLAVSTGKMSAMLDAAGQLVNETTGAAQQTRDILSDVKLGSQRLPAIAEATARTLDNIEMASKDIRTVSPELLPLIKTGQETIREVDDVVESARNSVLLRGSFPVSDSMPPTITPR